jgi:hypothetical protein
MLLEIMEIGTGRARPSGSDDMGVLQEFHAWPWSSLKDHDFIGITVLSMSCVPTTVSVLAKPRQYGSGSITKHARTVILLQYGWLQRK